MTTRDKFNSLIHHPYRSPAGFDASLPGVFQASTVFFPNMTALRALDRQARDAFWYGLFGTPTTFSLEERVATLEGGKHTLLVPSGMAAITLVCLALMKQGDEVLMPDNVYGTSKELACNELASWGITLRLYDPLDPTSLGRALSNATRVVWLEVPGSITMEFPDVGALIRTARQSDAVIALDNTWGAGVAFNPFNVADGQDGDLTVDVSVQALTKYASGAGDVLMGSVTTRDEVLHARLRSAYMRQGWGVGATDAQTLLRSLPTLALRYAAHDRAARTIAAWCLQRPEFAQVLHPALAGSRGHEQWRRYCGAAAGIFSVVLDERFDQTDVDRFMDSLRLFKIGYSWGGHVSLAMCYDRQRIDCRRLPRLEKGWLVRFSIGLEPVECLLDDLTHALSSMN